MSLSYMGLMLALTVENFCQTPKAADAKKLKPASVAARKQVQTKLYRCKLNYMSAN